MPSLLRRTALVLLSLTVTAAAWAGDSSGPATTGSGGTTARAVLETFSRDLVSLSAGFRQVVVSQDGEIMEQGEGEVWLARPDRFRWRYTGEFPELIVADGRHVWQYDESLEQVTVRAQSDLAADSPLLMITDLEGMDEAFRVTELGTLSEERLLELVSRDGDAQFERMVLGFRNGSLDRLVLEDAFGLRTELAFHDLRRNPELPEGHFSFEPPEGVDVIGEPPGPAD